MSLQSVAETVSQANIPNAIPSGNVGIALGSAYPYNTMRPAKWLVTAVVTSAPSDLFIWGALGAGVIADSTDDKWGLHNDKYGRIITGRLGTAIGIGTHHFIVENIACYTRLFFSKSAGSIDVFITPILESKRSS
jgi:hypothetical protein